MDLFQEKKYNKSHMSWENERFLYSVGYTLNQSIEKGYVDNMSDGGYPSKAVQIYFGGEEIHLEGFGG